jgi:fumarate hydratase, class II
MFKTKNDLSEEIRAKASKVAHYALDHDLTLKEAALQLGAVSAAEFDRIVDPRKMVKPYVAVN